MDDAALLARFGEQLRRIDGERVGAVVRHAGGWVSYSDLPDGAAADAEIAAQQAWFDRPFEWKYYDYDQPADLPERLLAAGFVAEPTEALMAAEIASLPATADLPAGLSIVPVVTDAEFAAIGELRSDVWGPGWRSLTTEIAGEYRADPAAMAVFRVVDGGSGETVTTGWIRFHAGTDFASLWGGATRPEWRRRGIYRALVAYRARLAADRGFSYLQVDASDDSRPILERLGFRVLARTTPYVWTPAG